MATRITGRSSTMSSKFKSMLLLRSDRQAEAFVANAHLTDYGLSGFKPMRFEIKSKTAALNMRLSKSLLEAVKSRAALRGVPTRATCACCRKKT